MTYILRHGLRKYFFILVLFISNIWEYWIRICKHNAAISTQLRNVSLFIGLYNIKKMIFKSYGIFLWQILKNALFLIKVTFWLALAKALVKPCHTIYTRLFLRLSIVYTSHIRYLWLHGQILEYENPIKNNQLSIRSAGKSRSNLSF